MALSPWWKKPPPTSMRRANRTPFYLRLPADFTTDALDHAARRGRRRAAMSTTAKSTRE